jgi:large subunit ribosomal protein L5
MPEEVEMKNKALKKIVVNMGVGKHKEDPKYLESAAEDLAVITGQRPATRTAKKAVAGFKLKPDEPVGLMVTLRGKRMRDFFEKLVNIVLPRLRDFRGVSRDSFDGSGNYSLGIEEHTVFPEIDPNKVNKIKGLEVTIVTTAETNEEGMKLLEELGIPFEKNG